MEKPLTNECLEALERVLKKQGIVGNESVTYQALYQARLGNQLAFAARRFLREFVDKTGQANDLSEKLAIYLGEENAEV